MNRLKISTIAGVCALAASCLMALPAAAAPIGLDLIIGVAPGGSVVRRRAVIGTTTAVATTSANSAAAADANAAAAANANAAAANANAAAAHAAGPPAVGTVTTTLPPGCTATHLNGVDYQRCGSTYYQPSMQGTNLVYVVAQP